MYVFFANVESGNGAPFGDSTIATTKRKSKPPDWLESARIHVPTNDMLCGMPLSSRRNLPGYCCRLSREEAPPAPRLPLRANRTKCRVRSSLSPWKKEWDPPPQMLWIHPIVWRKKKFVPSFIFSPQFLVEKFLLSDHGYGCNPFVAIVAAAAAKEFFLSHFCSTWKKIWWVVSIKESYWTPQLLLIESFCLSCMGWTLHEQAEEEAEAPGVLSYFWSTIVASGTAFCGRYCTNLFWS